MDDHVLSFFKTFSRFEFTLKESAYLKQNGNRNALPDWDKFVKDNKDKYKPSANAQNAVDALLSAPPNRQKVIESEEGKLSTCWEPMTFNENTPVLKKLTDIILCIRNNLFHGGKYGHKSWDDKNRTTFLLDNSIIAIKDLLNIDEQLSVHFNDFA
jgi:hypothetical protein